MITVMLQSGTYRLVSPDCLDKLVEKNRVKKFMRSDGWAVVGQDPVRTRSQKQEGYDGYERRRYASM